MKSIEVRAAKFSEHKEIVDFMIASNDEIDSVYRELKLDRDSITQTVQVSINDKFNCLFVLVIDGKIEGAVMGHAQQWWCSKSRVMTDLFFYTSPAGRGYGKRLLSLFLGFQNTINGIGCTVSGVTSGVGIDRTERLYSLVGAKKIGSLWKVTKA